MRAMVIREFGGPEVFEERDVPKPAPGPTELLVKVYATSVNPVDYKIRRAGAWAGVEPPAIIGYDVSGVVEEIGSVVEEWQPGDPVYYTPEILGGPPGSYAEYHVVDQAIVAHKPGNLSHVEAASIPLAGATAWGALVPRANIWAGETVLIHGCGGVGSLAVQIAKASGARVFVTCSDYMLDQARELGADRAIDYHTEDFVQVVEDETAGVGASIVFDTVGSDTLTRSMQVMQPFGELVGIVGTDTGFMGANAKNLTVRFMFLQRDRNPLNVLGTLLEREQIRPVIDAVMPLREVAEAHRRLEQGGVRGKIVLQVAED
jgi:NADPH2:quinone reductase